MAVLTRDQILAADDLKTERLEVAEWGGTVIVRTMTGADRDELEAAIVGADGRSKDATILRAKVVALSVVDEEGNRLFKFEEARELAKKSAAALARVAKVAMRLSAITDEAVEEIKGN